MFYATGLPFWARGFPAGTAPVGYGASGYQGELTPEREMEGLKAQADAFQKQVDMLNGRIKELEELAAKKRDSND
jgi:hypothetical protein